MILEPKHKNFKDENKIKELVKKKLISGATCLYQWLLNYITFRNFYTGDTVPLSRKKKFYRIFTVFLPLRQGGGGYFLRQLKTGSQSFSYHVPPLHFLGGVIGEIFFKKTFKNEKLRFLKSQLYCKKETISFFYQQLSNLFFNIIRSLEQLKQDFSIEYAFFSHRLIIHKERQKTTTKRYPRSFSYTLKITDANRLEIFVLICRYKHDLMLKAACQNVVVQFPRYICFKKFKFRRQHNNPIAPTVLV